jgi:hypothetical protein
MWDFLFAFNEYSENEGENFFVECESLEKAWTILEMSGIDSDEIEYIGRYTLEEAEILGYDTY